MREQSLTDEEISQLRTLLEIEKIRKKKALYSHLIDSLKHEEWADLFAEDAIAEWGPGGTWHGRDAIYEQVQITFKGRVPYYSLHMTTNLWIEMTGPATARSRAYLHDINSDTNPRINPVRFLGLYEEEWAKIDEDWKITRHRIQFFWPQRTITGDFPCPMTPTAIG